MPRQRFGKIGHIAKVYLGECIRAGKNPCKSKVPPSVVRRIQDRLISALGPGATVTARTGVWMGRREPTQTVEIATQEKSCEVFRRKVNKVAKDAGRATKQDAVMTVFHCGDGKTDVNFLRTR